MQTRYRNERGERERERERGPKKKKLNAAGVRAQTRHENKRRAKETRSKKKRKKRGAPPRRHCSILQKKTLLSLPPPRTPGTDNHRVWRRGRRTNKKKGQRIVCTSRARQAPWGREKGKKQRRTIQKGPLEWDKRELPVRAWILECYKNRESTRLSRGAGYSPPQRRQSSVRHRWVHA